MTLEDERFSTEAVRALGGAGWLADYRIQALSRLTQVSPAKTSGEDWRYGRIDELDLSRYELFDRPPTATPVYGERTAAFVKDLGEWSARIHLVDGALAEAEVTPAARSLGVVVRALSSCEVMPSGYGALAGLVDEPFSVLNDAFVRDAVVIEVADNAVVDLPIMVMSELTEASNDRLTFSRIFLRLGRLAEASVIAFQGSAASPSLHIPVTELVLEDGAQLRYDLVQHLGPAAWQLGYQLAQVARDASLRSFAAVLGGDYSRLYSRAALVGTGAQSKVSAAYLGIDDQVQEFRTFQDHVVGRTTSDLVFKGAVADRARSVYSGMIHMRKGARRADAAQTNRNLVLSEGAHADSVPNLDIEENDVRCSHASAVGPIDPEQRFYLESRGIPPQVAERLILLGFFDDLLSEANHSSIAAYVRDVVEERLASSTYEAIGS